MRKLLKLEKSGVVELSREELKQVEGGMFPILVVKIKDYWRKLKTFF